MEATVPEKTLKPKLLKFIYLHTFDGLKKEKQGFKEGLNGVTVKILAILRLTVNFFL